MKQRINKMKPVILSDFHVSCNECGGHSDGFVMSRDWNREKHAGKLPKITDVMSAVKDIRHKEGCTATRRWVSSEYCIYLTMRTVRPGMVHEHV